MGWTYCWAPREVPWRTLSRLPARRGPPVCVMEAVTGAGPRSAHPRARRGGQIAPHAEQGKGGADIGFELSGVIAVGRLDLFIVVELGHKHSEIVGVRRNPVAERIALEHVALAERIEESLVRDNHLRHGGV